MFTPDREVRARHTGISAQDEHYRVCLGNEVDGQLRLRTHGVQAGRVQNHQPLLQKRVRDIDDGVAPHGHLHHALRIGHRVLVRQIVMPETQRTRIVQTDLAHLRHFFEGFGNLVRVADVQGDLVPAVCLDAPLRQTLHLKPGFNR